MRYDKIKYCITINVYNQIASDVIFIRNVDNLYV